MRVFFGINSFHLPGELKKEFQQIDSGDTTINEYDFLRVCAVAGEEAILDCMEEYVVYFRTKGEAISFRKVREVLLPEAVRILQF